MKTKSKSFETKFDLSKELIQKSMTKSLKKSIFSQKKMTESKASIVKIKIVWFIFNEISINKLTSIDLSRRNSKLPKMTVTKWWKWWRIMSKKLSIIRRKKNIWLSWPNKTNKKLKMLTWKEIGQNWEKTKKKKLWEIINKSSELKKTTPEVNMKKWSKLWNFNNVLKWKKKMKI